MAIIDRAAAGYQRRSDTPALDRERTSHPASDPALINAAAAGDRAALATLYDRHAATAYSLAAGLVGPAAAEDVVHDAFIALVERRSTFDPALGTFRAWFLTAIHRRCLTQLQARGRLAGPEEAPDVPDPAPEPPDQIVGRLRDLAVREALERLGPAQREVLVLAYYGGLTQTDLATRLDLPLGTVKARMRRGLIALRGLLRGEAVEERPESGEEEAR